MTPSEAPSTGFFLSEVSLELDGISKEMNDDASSALENVTKLFLEVEFRDAVEIDDVAVIGQSVVVFGGNSKGGKGISKESGEMI